MGLWGRQTTPAVHDPTLAELQHELQIAHSTMTRQSGQIGSLTEQAVAGSGPVWGGDG